MAVRFLVIVSFLVCLVNCDDSVNIFPPLPVGVPKTDNQLCQSHSDSFREHLKNLTLWAHEMWDATAQSATGVLRGNVFQMGNFDQCLTARAPFSTQYCLATLTANIPRPQEPRDDELSLYFRPDASVLQRLYKYKDKTQQSRNVINVGWCVPASCSVKDLEQALNDYLNSSDILLSHSNVTYTATFNDLFCHTKAESTYFNAGDIVFCILCAVLLILTAFGTLYEYNRLRSSAEKKPQKTSILQKLILGFSARKNFVELNHLDESDSALKILYGIKTIAILLIIMDHRFGTFTSSAILNFDYVEQQYRSPLACFLFHGDLFVDTFFIFSGLLVAYGLLNQFDKRKINPGFIILLRYIRLTPVYAFVIFYYATILNHTGSGPLWKVVVGGDFQDCKTNWWANLLYISNYVNADHMCMAHSWFLPCDFHYFIIAIGLCMLIHRQRKLGLCALFFVVLASMIIPFMITVVLKRPSMLFFYPDFLTNPKMHVDYLLTYIKSHTRATPYFVGMGMGYIYYRVKGTNKHVCRNKSYLILSGSVAIILIAILTGAVFYDPYHNYNAVESGIYAALHRGAWAIGSCGLLYVASFGHAAPLFKILTWSPWIPLSKLVYGAYLIHMQFQLRWAAKFMSPQKIGYFDLISLALSDMVLAFVSSLILYLTIEAPFKNIFRELLTPRRPEKDVSTMGKEMTERSTVDPELSVASMVRNPKISQGSRL